MLGLEPLQQLFLHRSWVLQWWQNPMGHGLYNDVWAPWLISKTAIKLFFMWLFSSFLSLIQPLLPYLEDRLIFIHDMASISMYFYLFSDFFFQKVMEKRQKTKCHRSWCSWGCTTLYNDSPSPWVMGLYNIGQLSVGPMGHETYDDPRKIYNWLIARI